MKTAIDIGLRKYYWISLGYGLAYSIISLLFLAGIVSVWLKNPDANLLPSRNKFFDPGIVKYFLVIPAIAAGYFLFVGIREIVTSTKRYRKLTVGLQNISPKNVLIKLQIHPFSRGCTYYIVDLYPDRANPNSQPFARLNIMAPTWNIGSILDRIIPAKAYFDPAPQSGVLLRVKDKFLVHLPNAIDTFKLFRS